MTGHHTVIFKIEICYNLNFFEKLNVGFFCLLFEKKSSVGTDFISSQPQMKIQQWHPLHFTQGKKRLLGMPDAAWQTGHYQERRPKQAEATLLRTKWVFYAAP